MNRLLVFACLCMIFPSLCRGQGEYHYGGDIAWMRGGGFGTITELALFPDGKRIVAAAYSIKIYDVETGNVLKTLIGESHTVSAVDLSRDGKVIAGTGDYEITLWDAETGEVIRRILTGVDVGTVSLSADGRYVAAGGYGGVARVWETATGKEKTHFQVGEGIVDYVRFSRYGDTLAASEVDSHVKLWDVSSDKLLWEYIPPYPGVAPPMAFSPDGRYLAFIPDDRYLLQVDLHGGFATDTIAELDFTRGYSLAYSPDGKELAMGIRQGVFLWETATVGLPKYIPVPIFESTSLVFSNDGALLFVGGGIKGELAVVDIIQGKWTRFLNEYTSSVRSVNWSPDGTLVAASTIDWAFIHSGETGVPIATLPIRFINVCEAMRFSPDGKWLAGGCDDSLRIWTAGIWERYPRTLKASPFFLTDITWSPDNQYIVGSDFRHLWHFNLENDSITSPYQEDSVIAVLRWSPDGRYLIGGGGDGVVRMWDAETGALVHNLDRQHTFASTIGGLDITKDGSRFVTGALDGRVILWDLPTATPMREVFHEGGVFTVGFTPDGAYMLSGGLDGRIIVWDVTTGDSVYVYHERPFYVAELAVSPDGRLVLFGTDDGLVAYHARWKSNSVPGERGEAREERVVLLSAGPNPASQEIVVRFIVNPGETVAVGLELYDTRGERLQSVVRRRYEAGLHEVHLPVMGLPSGSYFLRLAEERSTETLPVIVVR